MLHFGKNNDKKIKFGFDSFFDPNDHKSQIERFNHTQRLVRLLNKYESFFDDQSLFDSQSVINTFGQYGFITSRELKTKDDPTAWNDPNAQFDKQKQDWLNVHIPKLVQLGIISEIDKAPNYINSIDVTLNEDNEFELNPNFDNVNHKNNFRFIIDGIVAKSYIDKKIFEIPSSSIFSKIKIKYASYYFELKENYRKYTSFKLKINNDENYRYYQFNRLHPNMKITIIHMLRTFEVFFKNFKSIIRTFGDQILILSKTIEDHIDNLETFFNHLSTVFEKFNIKISSKDSIIIVKELEFYDLRLDGQGISISQRIKDQFKDKLKYFQSSSLKDREWLRNLVFKYKLFFKDLKYFEINQETLFEKNNQKLCQIDIGVNFFIKAFLTPIIIPYESQNLQIDLSKISQSDLPEYPSKKIHLNSPQNSQHYSQQIPQQNLCQNLQQIPHLQQYLQRNPHLQQYLQQQIIQRFQKQYLEQIIQDFQIQYQQQIQHPNSIQNPQIIQQNLLQYLQQNPPQNPQENLEEISQ